MFPNQMRYQAALRSDGRVTGVCGLDSETIRHPQARKGDVFTFHLRMGELLDADSRMNDRVARRDTVFSRDAGIDLKHVTHRTRR